MRWLHLIWQLLEKSNTPMYYMIQPFHALISAKSDDRDLPPECPSTALFLDAEGWGPPTSPPVRDPPCPRRGPLYPRPIVSELTQVTGNVRDLVDYSKPSGGTPRAAAGIGGEATWRREPEAGWPRASRQGPAGSHECAPVGRAGPLACAPRTVFPQEVTRLRSSHPPAGSVLGENCALCRKPEVCLF